MSEKMKTITGVKIGIAIGTLMIINRYFSKQRGLTGKYSQRSVCLDNEDEDEDYKDYKDCNDKNE